MLNKQINRGGVTSFNGLEGDVQASIIAKTFTLDEKVSFTKDSGKAVVIPIEVPDGYSLLHVLNFSSSGVSVAVSSIQVNSTRVQAYCQALTSGNATCKCDVLFIKNL